MIRPEKLLLASGNKHKYIELSAKLSEIDNLRIILPENFGIRLEVDEDGDTLEENARKKAVAYYKLFRIPTLADDTGLFVKALGGLPGVRSARYAGEDAGYSGNRKKLLDDMKSAGERAAEFRSVLCLALSEDECLFFEGSCKGMITLEEKGDGGFGYDPLFVPDGYTETFAEMKSEMKNTISHRGIALDRFREFITTGEYLYPVEDSNL